MSHAIYLSGWEYNRLLQSTPLAPVVSGLPAQVLWDGAAQFWLFKTVYCTKEALDGDYAAYRALGWTTGRIFADLARRGFLTPVDWSKDVTLHEDLTTAHRLLREHVSPSEIRAHLENGRVDELEAIKLRLLLPILRHLKCVKNVSPNAISQWITPRRVPQETPSSATVALLGDALRRATGPLRAGFRLCDPPGTGLPADVVKAQREVEQRVQRPLIPALLEGTLPQDDYHIAAAGEKTK